MKKYFPVLLFVLLTGILFNGCATVLKGYEDRVDLVNAPDGMKVFTQDGVELEVKDRHQRAYSAIQKKYIDTCFVKVIYLRSNKDHVLKLKYQGKEQLVERFGHISAGYFLADVLLVFPVFVDIYTGNWNHFDPIYVNF